ncbi:MAG: 30S ribosomal protein S6 [Planctomycetota bacterium]|nr:30S ribosomal protein S6 [Planctomycetaceae bacterium]MDQ3332484.1 30S ribosomal protein S6 [Planctomycetota bacterium]
MTTNNYEGMFLLDSADYASDPDGMSQMLTELIERLGGTVAAHRPWQDGRLAYEIKGRRKGLHYLVMFTLDTSKMAEVNRACRLNEKILRTLFITHPKVLFDATVAAINPDGEHAESGEATEEQPAEVAEAAAE